MEVKRRILEFVAAAQVTDSAGLADAFGYTRSGAASTLLRLHRHGHLHRRRIEAAGYEHGNCAER